jgi:hypothetical protein
MIHKFNRKHINTIMNVDDSLTDDSAVIDKALEFVAMMCDPSVTDCAVFYIHTDDEGKIKLEMET